MSLRGSSRGRGSSGIGRGASTALRPGGVGVASSSSSGSAGPGRPNAVAASNAPSYIAALGGQAGVGGGYQKNRDTTGRITEYSSEDDKCPTCHSERFMNPKLRLLVSPCYHKMCENCVDRIFGTGPANCPTCGQLCRRHNFGIQTFQDLSVEKEVDIRRMVARIFNKREEDFEDLKTYNNYLERVEEITFNLINGIDVAATNAKIEEYKQSNAVSAATNSRNVAAESDAAYAAEQAERAEKAAARSRRSAFEAAELEETERAKRERVAALTRGVSEEELRRLQSKQAKEEGERRRRFEREEERLASVSEAARRVGGQSIREQGSKDAGERPWCAEMLWDFEGPLAVLDDCHALFDVRPTPANMGGVGNASAAAAPSPFFAGRMLPSGLPAYDEEPWWPAHTNKESARLWRAGGFDRARVWERDMRASMEGLGMVPMASG